MTATKTAMSQMSSILFVLFFALIPVGEGAALTVLALLALLAIIQWRDLDFSALGQGAVRNVLVCLGLWFLVGILMLWLGGEGWQKPSELGRWTGLLAIPLVFVWSRKLEYKWLQYAVTAFVLVLFFGAVFGMLQYFFNARPGEHFFRAALSNATQNTVPGRPERTVAGGFFFHRLKMAHVGVLGMGILVARQLFFHMGIRRRMLELVVLTSVVAAVLLTYTRGAVLGMLAGVAASIWFASRRVRLVSLAGVVLAIALALTSPSVRDRIASIQGQQASSVRALIWSQAVEVLLDHPLGIGLGNYPKVIGRYYDAVEPSFSVRTYPHSVLLAALVETGPLGMACYVAAFVFLGLLCMRLLRDSNAPPWQKTNAGAGLFALAAFWTIGLSHDVLFHQPVSLAFAALLGFVLSALHEPVRS